MTQDQAAKMILQEMIAGNMIFPKYQNIISSKIKQAIGVGFDIGISYHSDNHQKPIAMINNKGVTIETFEGARKASIMTKISHGNISSAANGKRQTAGGYYWKYLHKNNKMTNANKPSSPASAMAQAQIDKDQLLPKRELKPLNNSKCGIDNPCCFGVHNTDYGLNSI